jgi:hypothetical protein
MSTEQKNAEQNALASRLGNFWTNFKQGKLISYKLMAILLIVVAVLGTWWYIARESRKAVSAQWLELDEAATPTQLEELIKKDPKSVVARVAELDLARSQLGPEGLDRFNALTTAERMKGVESVEKAREAYANWLEKSKTDSVFKNDLSSKAECLWALARAEEGLVGVPAAQAAPTGASPVAPSDDRRGDVSKAVEYFDQLVELASANPRISIPWVEEAKKRAEAMRKDPAGFKRTAGLLFEARAEAPGTGSPVPPPPPMPPFHP